MASLPKGVHKIRKTLKDGSKVTYFYAWRGGPRLFAKPGTAEFQIEYGAALQKRKEVSGDTLLSVIVAYRQSPKYLSLAKSTRHYRAIYLDEIQLKFGDMPLEVLDDVKIKDRFVKWRDEHIDKPKAADMRIETLRVLVAFAHERGLVNFNHVRGISKVYTNDRSDVIWTPDEIELVKGHATDACARVIDFARLTGIRKGDLIKLTWDADKGEYLEWKTSKTGKRIFVPVLPELRALMDGMERFDTILTNSHDKPWKAPALQNAFRRAKMGADIKKRFHDLRGTFATMLIERGVSDQRVADIMGWSKYRVAEIRRVYVDNSAIIKDVLRQLSVE